MPIDLALRWGRILTDSAPLLILSLLPPTVPASVRDQKQPGPTADPLIGGGGVKGRRGDPEKRPGPPNGETGLRVRANVFADKQSRSPSHADQVSANQIPSQLKGG